MKQTMRQTMRRYSLAELKALPTLACGQTDDLKVNEDVFRVWISRMGKEEGLPYSDQVTAYIYYNDEWKLIDTYQAK